MWGADVGLYISFLFPVPVGGGAVVTAPVPVLFPVLFLVPVLFPVPVMVFSTK